MNNNCSCFYYLRQLRSIRLSLQMRAITILVHAALTWARVDYGNAVFLQLMHLNFNLFSMLLPVSQSSPIFFLSPETPFTGFVRASYSRSIPSWEAVLMALLHNTSRLTVSQLPLYLVVHPSVFGSGPLGCSPETYVY